MNIWGDMMKNYDDKNTILDNEILNSVHNRIRDWFDKSDNNTVGLADAAFIRDLYHIVEGVDDADYRD